jgi:hypothetical protein
MNEQNLTEAMYIAQQQVHIVKNITDIIAVLGFFILVYFLLRLTKC